mgnify:CR=1 FL=1
MMIGNKSVYKTTSVDDFTNEGVYTLVVLQTVFNSKDDFERNLAYNEEFKEVFNRCKLKICRYRFAERVAFRFTEAV